MLHTHIYLYAYICACVDCENGCVRVCETSYNKNDLTNLTCTIAHTVTYMYNYIHSSLM